MHRKLKIENHNSKIEHRLAAFTLTETLVASTLLIIAIVPILKGLTRVHFDSVKIERKSYSLTLAQAKLDEIKARSVYHYGDSYTENDTSLDGSYLCDVTDDSADPLRTITVSVGYDQDGDSTLSTGEVMVELSTYIARRW